VKDRYIYYIISLLLLSNNLLAQEARTISLGKVVVTDDSSDQLLTGDTNAKKHSGFSNVIQKENFQDKQQNLGELIEKESSVQVQQSGGLGSFSSVSLRGASSNQVMVYMDGVPLNDSSGGGVDLSNIPVEQIESVEIYKGNSPINLSGSSIGGALNIKTKRAKQYPSADASIGYGSFNSFKINSTVSQKPGRFDYLVNGGYSSSKNNFSFINDNGTKWNTNDDEKEKRNNAEYYQGNVLGTFSYDISQKTRASISEQFFMKNQHLPTWNNNPKATTTFDTKRNIVNLKLISNELIGKLNSASRLDHSYKKEIYSDTNNDVGLGKQHNKYVTTSYGLNQFFELPTSFNNISSNIDIRQENYNSYDLLYQANTEPSTRNYYSVALQDKISLINRTLAIIPAITLEHYDNKFRSSSSPRIESNNYFNPKIGAKYNLISWLNIKSNLARYVREPSFFELFGDRGFFNGNKDLKAEKGVNFDIGLEAETKIIYFSSTYFRTNIDDVISYVYNSRGIGQAVNISSSVNNGIENTLLLEPLKGQTISLNYTWQNPVNKSKVPVFNNKRLPGKFEDTASIKLSGTYLIFKPYYEFIYSSGLFYDTANLLPAKIKREHNAGITTFIGPFSANVEVKNIGNVNYEDFNGYPQPGRSFWLTLRYELN